MPRYDSLRTASFMINDTIRDFAHTFYTLEFPQHWEREFKQLQSALNPRSTKWRSLPIKNLNQALRALAPSLISVSKYFDINSNYRKGSRPYKWLFSSKPIDNNALHLIVSNWADITFAKAPAESRQRVLSNLDPADLSWQQNKLDLAEWETHPNGTAKAVDADCFNLLPDWIAAKLSRPDIFLKYGPERIRLRRVSPSVGGRGVELMSWPPIEVHDSDRQAWYYSVRVTFSVQTVPFQGYPLVYCNLGIRRWVSHSNTYLRGGKTSVYLLTQVPWINGFEQSDNFQVAPIRWYRRNSKNNSGFELDWDAQLTQLLNNLHPHTPFPRPEDIVNNPIASLNVGGSPCAAIVYSNGMIPSHKVGTGFMPVDRRAIIEQIADILKPELILTPEIQKSPFRGRTSHENPFFERSSLKDTKATYQEGKVFADRRALIGQATNGRLTIELRNQSGAFLEAAITHLCETLGLREPQALPHSWQTPELVFTIVAQRLGKIGDSLAADDGSKNRNQPTDLAIRNRIREIIHQEKIATEATGTFIELGGAESFEQSKDPKLAIRLGFAATRRPTQFIQLGRDDLENRLKSGFLDLLRQLGVVPDLTGLPESEIPSPLNYVGLWLINQQGKPFIPVMVHVSSSDRQLRGTAPGIDGWIPYRDLLTAVAEGKVEQFTWKDQARIVRYIQERLEGDVLALGDTLLLCHAQNLRSTWKWLQDGNIMADKLAFGKEAPQPTMDSSWQGLRIVRVRGSANNETPEWYAVDGEQQGFSQGLFRIGERVFASTFQKPAAMKNLSPSRSRIKTVVSATDKTYKPDPEVYAWNPAIYEITVACLQPNDSPANWAYLVHSLRNLSIHFNDPTALPFPLHLAKQVEEYIS